ncbi:hypothetical protein [Salibacterium qingdaonense]|uniref:Uncharacterized protein n=1 Tax=Salibacterium qingdaonense TaxID=266892 RepID=A0A1I4NY22_9BACI|nr:hypothetical protein [Salibacterium qingdaonense]SFM20474.1 hypothetical protein SAMN04488054_12146 [Salibacterium qingdaonense]
MNNIFNSPEFRKELRETEEAKAKMESSEMVGEAKHQPDVEAGTFPAVTKTAVYSRNVQSPLGINDKIDITYTIFVPTSEGTLQKIEKDKSYWKSPSEKAKYTRTLSGLLNADPRQAFRLEDLMGIPCEVEITHKTTDKGTFANISKVTRVDIEALPDQFTL